MHCNCTNWHSIADIGEIMTGNDDTTVTDRVITTASATDRMTTTVKDLTMIKENEIVNATVIATATMIEVAMTMRIGIADVVVTIMMRS